MSTVSAGNTPDGDFAYQARILQRVSRTYALTIPALPAHLQVAVGNAYLLCRITDTIEDEPELTLRQKRAFWERLDEVVSGRGEAPAFARDLAAALSSATPEAEHELVAGLERVLRVTRQLRSAERAAIERCIRTMSQGMAEFQQRPDSVGLEGPAALDRYCYFAAGVVGEMVVELFCCHSDAIERRRTELLALATSHAQGLQMANILKDIWDDWQNGACWLPRDVFQAAGFDLGSLSAGRAAPGFDAGLSRLVAMTHGHLSNALRFIQLIPARETGIRRHLLWGVGLAVLALRRVYGDASFRQGEGIRVSRLAVGAMIVLTSVLARWDAPLTLLFRAATRGLPSERRPPAGIAAREGRDATPRPPV